ncbi:hypothetical protein HOLleu_29941 [Holothuria leucospilota]|uniref:Reverse transcriptase domain-containing protein n=1 Tax=Holothuria leucospilota TaxID=206669 RepID=A0A9Q1GW74_HOLLE|nr:hypothetical protein HOLleu_29941 [Holothuria leucospilota]
MDQINYGYSTKNITIPQRSEYIKTLIEKTESFIKRLRWKAYFYLNPDRSPPGKENYGFKSRKCPPQIKELSAFENDLLELISHVKFKNVNCAFHDQLDRDSTSIKNSDKLVIPADKTTNFYNLSLDLYNKLLVDNITATYKATDNNVVNEINRDAKCLATKLDLADRIDIPAKKEAYITLKDHKPNFVAKPKCRLINPAKSELGNISKVILDKCNSKLLAVTKIQQWKNTMAVVSWFSNLANKSTTSFICFDIVDFYPSITEDLLSQALNFALLNDAISEQDLDIVMHCRKSLLFHDGKPWVKKSSEDLFDVTMGSFDGAEICELVGTFPLHKITQKYDIGRIGLYRDDGLAAFDAPPQKIERIKKDLCQIFSNYHLRITVEANMKTINYLDVTLDLTSGQYYPYSKPNSIPLYVNSKSNHPPQIIRNLPSSINRRLSDLSSNEAVFNKVAPTYQQALNDSGYTHKLTYSESSLKKKRNRLRNIIWFNPPFSMNVKTNIGHLFLNLVKKHFPTGSALHKIFNRNTLKISYCCMGNIQRTINSHNQALLTKSTTVINDSCNCRNKDICPVPGQCNTSSPVVYQATVSTIERIETYVGLADSFKPRYHNHIKSFNYSGLFSV